MSSKCWEVQNKIIEKPVSILTYEQSEFGALAWVAEVVHDSPKGKIVFRMPLLRSGDGFIVREFYAELPENVEFSLGLVSNKSSKPE